ncbi:MAG: 50S ribosomal protein L19 [Candidatus Uhrbacteria bacterium]
MSDEDKTTQDETTEDQPVEAPVVEPKTEETKEEDPAEEKAEEPAPEATPEPEPPSPISDEMQDTTRHKGKMIGGEDVAPGMTVRAHERIIDVSPKGEKRERVQVFEGIILDLGGAGNKRTMTIRKISKGGFGVEKIFPLASPNLVKIEVVKSAKIRRAKLTYLRNLKQRFKRKLKETWVK